MEREEGLRTGGLTAGAAGYGLSSGAAGSGLQSGGLEISNTRRKPYPAINVQTQLEIPVSGGGVAGDKHPWKVSIVPHPTAPLTGKPIAVMSPKGNIVDELLGITLLEINNWSGESLKRTIDGTGVLCMLITKATGEDNPSMEVVFLEDDDYEPFDVDTSVPPLVTATRYPLALIADNPDPPPTGGTRADDYIVKQLARSHMAISNICINGQTGPSLTPI